MLFTHYGYKAVLLETTGPQIAQTGLKYVHNDTCYPAILVIGQMIDALIPASTIWTTLPLMITQTGGGRRASNYIHLLRKALKKAGYEKGACDQPEYFGSGETAAFILLPAYDPPGGGGYGLRRRADTAAKPVQAFMKSSPGKATGWCPDGSQQP